MCFTIPLKVLRARNSEAIVEGNRRIKIGSELTVQKGDYLHVVGNVGVSSLSCKDGLAMRRLIRSLNKAP